MTGSLGEADRFRHVLGADDSHRVASTSSCSQHSSQRHYSFLHEGQRVPKAGSGSTTGHQAYYRRHGNWVNQSPLEVHLLEELQQLNAGQARMTKLLERALGQVSASIHMPSHVELQAKLVQKMMPSKTGHAEDAGGPTLRRDFEDECGQKEAVLIAKETESEALLQGKPLKAFAFLPPNWPQSLPLRILDPSERRGSDGVDNLGWRRPAWSSTAKQDKMPKDNADGWSHVWTKPCVEALHDILILVVLFYDLCVKPFILAWDMAYEGINSTMGWVAVSIWTLDLAWSAARAVATNCDDDKVQCRGSLFLDAIITVCDWISIVLHEVIEHGDVQWTPRVLVVAKIGRLVSILRVTKLLRMMEGAMEIAHMEGWRLLMTFGSILVGFLWLVHLLSCGWYAIGTGAPTGIGSRWVHSNALQDFGSQDVLYQYLTSLHLVATVVTLGAMEVNAGTAVERLFIIFCLFLGWLLSTAIVSFLSAKLVESRMAQHELDVRLQRLRRYLYENCVDKRQSLSLMRHVHGALSKQQRLVERDVELVQFLSTSLSVQMHHAVFRPHLIKHPVFRLLDNFDSSAVRQLCHLGIEFVALSGSDELFLAGDPGLAAYLVISGSFLYIQDDVRNARVLPNHWLCDAALWCHWLHVGTLEASAAAYVLAVSAEALSEVLIEHDVGQTMVRSFARAFHRCVALAGPPRSPWPTDLSVPFADFDDIILSLDQEQQLLIGKEALEAASKVTFHGNSASDQKRLLKEVESGRSILTLRANGTLLRTVSVIAFRIVDKDGRILVQLGKYENSVLKPSCQLPGGKQERGQVVNDAAKRMLELRMAPLAGSIETTHIERTVVSRQHDERGVLTEYLRTVFHAFLVRDVDMMRCRVSQMPGSLPETGGLRKPKQFWIDDSEIIAIPDSWSERVHFYAWLRDREFEVLQGSCGKQAVLDMLGKLDIRSIQTQSPTSSLEKGGNSLQAGQAYEQDCPPLSLQRLLREGAEESSI